MDTPIKETETTPRHHSGRHAGATTMTAETTLGTGTEQQQITIGEAPRRDVPPQGLALPAKENALAGLTIGSIVAYVLPIGRSYGEIRPAIVVRVWSKQTGGVQLQVFTDGTNDFEHGQNGANGIFWATSVAYSTDKTPGTWHWPERV